MSAPQPPSLSVSSLFTPMSSGVGQNGAVPLSPPMGTWLYYELSVAATVQLPTTAWQAGGAERELLAVSAVMYSQSDANASIFAQSAFLDSAATGTVTYQALNLQQITVPVTPDPSNPAQNPTGALGWLDLTTQGVYSVFRIEASYATGPLAIANTGATSIGPYAVGLYRTASQYNTYTNTTSLTIPSSVIAGGGGTVTGVSVGLSQTIVTCGAPPAPGSTVYINVPVASGVSGLAGVFAIVTASSSNTFSVAIGSSGTYTSGGQVYACTTATMQASVLGTAGNASPGAVTTTVTQNPGVLCANVVPWSGSNWESNTALASRARLSMAAASPNGPSQAYVYFAESSVVILAAQTPAYNLTNGAIAANGYANPQTGIYTLVVASQTPQSSVFSANVTPGCAQNLITAATDATPVVLTVTNPCGMTTGMTATVTGVLGNQGANGTYTVTVSGPSSTTVTLNGSVGTGTYTGGGSVEGGDLGMIDQLVQQNVVPDAIVAAQTVSALALPVTGSAVVTVPAAYAQTYRLAVPAALAAQTGSYEIGGYVSAAETLPIAWDDYLGALKAAGILTLGSVSYATINSLSVTVNSVVMTNSTQSVPFPTNQYQAIQGAFSVQVIGV